MSRSLLVARREFLENVRTRGYWLSLAAVPLVLLLALAVPLVSELSRPVLSFGASDASGWLLEAVVERADREDFERLLARRASSGAAVPAPPPLRALLEEVDLTEPTARRELAERLARAPAAGPETAFVTWWRSRRPEEVARLLPGAWRARFDLLHAPERWIPPERGRRLVTAERAFAWIGIPPDPVGTPGDSVPSIEYLSRNLTDTALKQWLERQLGAVVEDQRRAEAGIGAAAWRWVSTPPELSVRTPTGIAGGQRAVSTGDVLAQWGPVAFVYLLWVSIFAVTQMLLTSTVEEKSNKLVEVLLATLSPVELMAGKILGIAATGLSIVAAWTATFVLATLGLPALLGAPGLDLGGLATDPVYLTSFLVYFLLGYFFYAALLAGVGSVCNTLKEAQNLMIPVQFVLFVPLLAMIPIARDPDGTIGAILTWIPPFTPFVMMNRAAQPPDAWVYLATTLLMLAAIAAALWAAAKIYRIGILMTGRPPTLREMSRWLAAPVSARARREDARTPHSATFDEE